MKHILYISFSLMLLIAQNTGAQQFTNYTSENTSMQIDSNSVNTIAVDKEGNLWFGMPSNIIKFDGSEWSIFNVNIESGALLSVHQILVDSVGNLWIVVVTGITDILGTTLIKYDGMNWKYYNFPQPSTPGAPLNITLDNMKSFWIGTSWGVYKFVPDTTVTHYFIHEEFVFGDPVTTIAIDNNGDKWFGTPKDVSVFDDENWTYYTTEDGLVDNNVISMAIDHDGIKWIGTNKGVSRFDGVSWTTFNTEDGLADNVVSIIMIDKYNNKWFGTPNGLTKFDGVKWTTYTTKEGLINNHVTSIAVDNENNIWIGTENGISKLSFEYTGVDSKNYTSKNLIIYPNPVQSKVFIQMNIRKNQHVTVQILDNTGRLLHALLNQILPAGKHEIEFDTTNLTAGIYFFRLITNEGAETRKMIKQ